MKNPFKKGEGREPLLLTPGPVLLSPNIKAALSLPMWHHRSPEFKKILKQISSDLKEIFQTSETVLILNSTGTGAMEAALSNSLSPGDEVFCICTGKFSSRWKDISEAFGIKVWALDVPQGASLDISLLERELKRHKNIKALLISACETSTATELPIQEISELLKKYPDILFIVDGITGLGAMELPMDKWGIDVLIAGSQKSFMIPAGLAFIALSEKAWQASEKSKCSKYYFDLKKERKAQGQGQTAFSSSVTLIRALKASLDSIKKQGLKACISRCEILQKSTHAFCKDLGLSLYSSRPAHSVTAIKVPPGFSGGEIKKNLEEKEGIVLAGGQGDLKNQILRLGHLGPIKPKDQLRGLKALAGELQKKEPQIFTNAKIKEALRKAEKVLEDFPGI